VRIHNGVNLGPLKLLTILAHQRGFALFNRSLSDSVLSLLYMLSKFFEYIVELLKDGDKLCVEQLQNNSMELQNRVQLLSSLYLITAINHGQRSLSSVE